MIEKGKTTKKKPQRSVTKQAPRRAPAKPPRARAESVVVRETYLEAVGRRKNATARVRIFKSGDGFLVNEKTLEAYFPTQELQQTAQEALRETKLFGRVRVSVHVTGGGVRGQAEAIRHGIARALLKVDIGLRPTLKVAGYLRRDPRMKERRKYGLKKARRAPQWAKR